MFESIKLNEFRFHNFRFDIIYAENIELYSDKRKY